MNVVKRIWKNWKRITRKIKSRVENRWNKIVIRTKTLIE